MGHMANLRYLQDELPNYLNARTAMSYRRPVTKAKFYLSPNDTGIGLRLEFQEKKYTFHISIPDKLCQDPNYLLLNHIFSEYKRGIPIDECIEMMKEVLK